MPFWLARREEKDPRTRQQLHLLVPVDGGKELDPVSGRLRARPQGLKQSRLVGGANKCESGRRMLGYDTQCGIECFKNALAPAKIAEKEDAARIAGPVRFR